MREARRIPMRADGLQKMRRRENERRDRRKAKQRPLLLRERKTPENLAAISEKTDPDVLWFRAADMLWFHDHATRVRTALVRTALVRATRVSATRGPVTRDYVQFSTSIRVRKSFSSLYYAALSSLYEVKYLHLSSKRPAYIRPNCPYVIRYVKLDQS